MLKSICFNWKETKVLQTLFVTLARFFAAYPPEMCFDEEVLNTNAW